MASTFHWDLGHEHHFIALSSQHLRSFQYFINNPLLARAHLLDFPEQWCYQEVSGYIGSSCVSLQLSSEGNPRKAIFRETVLAIMLPCGMVGLYWGRKGQLYCVVTVWKQTFYLFIFLPVKVQISQSQRQLIPRS